MMNAHIKTGALLCAGAFFASAVNADTVEYQFNNGTVQSFDIVNNHSADWYTRISKSLSTAGLGNGIQTLSVRFYDESEGAYSEWLTMPFFNRHIESAMTHNGIVSLSSSVTDASDFVLEETLVSSASGIPQPLSVNESISLVGSSVGTARISLTATDDTNEIASVELPFRLFSQRNDGEQLNQIFSLTIASDDDLSVLNNTDANMATWTSFETELELQQLSNLMTLSYSVTDSANETSALNDLVVLSDGDGDGVPDITDVFPEDPDEQLDTDGDGIGNNADLDDDGDGIPDEYEVMHDLDPLNDEDAGLDNDSDGFSNLEEYLAGTDPNDAASTPLKVAVALDFDGDGIADIAVRRASTFFQYVRNSEDNSITRQVFGKNASDIPIYGDFDGDGKTDIGVRRASNYTWYILNSSGEDKITGNADGITRRVFGRDENDIPVPADYDGDGMTDIAVRRPSTQFWYILNSSGVDQMSGNEDGVTRRRFGTHEDDIPVPADYDGDERADLAVRRADTQYWYVLNSSGVDAISGNSDGITRMRFGAQSEDIPVPADFDGDGKADLAIRRPSTQVWYVLNSSGSDPLTHYDDGISRIRFGSREDDIPVVADYDGDGKADIAVRRASTFYWYIHNSSGSNVGSEKGDGIQRILFGLRDTDIPFAAPIQIRMSMLSDE